MARLSLALLGPFQATLDGEPVSGPISAKARVLLAYLAVESDRAHSREALATLLWPEDPAEAALASLRNALPHLRRAVGDHQATHPCLLITRDTVQLDPT